MNSPMISRRLSGARWLVAATLVASAVVLGQAVADDAEPPAAPTAPAVGRIAGQVRFAGTAPPPAELHAHHDPEVCAKGGPLIDERLLVDGAGGLANVVVVLQGVPAAPPPSPTTATLDQKACRFVPHVQAVPLGTTLAITSSDPVLHNVHAFLGKRTAFNLAIPVPGKTVPRKLEQSGILRIRCDSGHDWMSAYVAVVPHRFFAVSAPDGRFALDDVPPGEYRLRAWHESLGAVEQRVTVAAGVDAAVSLTFKELEDDAKPAPTDALRDALAATKTAVEELEARQRADERGRLAREGAPLFRKFCAICHGQRGDGRGPSAQFTTTPPRDLTRGTFKFRMTPVGAPPTQADLIRTINAGVRGTHMPAWKGKLTPTQIETLARYVTTLSDPFWTGAPPPELLVIPPEPAYDLASVERGKALYAKMQCATCHGERGAGDGPAAAALKDDWGHTIAPADFTRGRIKGGCCGAAIYRAISTGLGGTPMPSFGAAMSPAERWDLTHYVLSLGHERPAVDYLLRDPVGRISP